VSNTSVMEEILASPAVTFRARPDGADRPLIVGIPIGVYAALKQTPSATTSSARWSILALAIPHLDRHAGDGVPSLWWGWSRRKVRDVVQDPVAHLLQLLIPR